MPAWLERNPFLVIALAGFLLLGGLLARDALSSREAPVLVFRDSALEPGTPIRVHVTGAVEAPGVYELSSGDRVADAVAAAGGPRAGADLDAINLARRLRDGEQIRIAGPDAVAAPLLPPGQPLDLNLATQEQLMGLPGIGEAYSRRILDSRVVDGPFTSVDELVERGLLPASTLEVVRPLISVTAP
jgi:competence protein ComEA